MITTKMMSHTKKYMSFTLSEQDIETILKSLMVLKNEVIVNPKKHFDCQKGEIEQLIEEIKERKKNWIRF